MKVQDPVCGMRFEKRKAVATAEFEGQSYHFCADGCKELFEREPGRFARSDVATVPDGATEGGSS